MAQAISKMETTAVNWLMEQMLKPDMYKIWPTLLEKAKEIEKEQIIDAHNAGKNILPPNDSAEQYYNETYGS